MLNKILVALDFSDRNRYIFQSALFLAQAMKAELMLLHIISEKEADYPSLPASAYAYYSILNDQKYDLYLEQLADYEKRGLEQLQSLTQEALEVGVSTEYSQLTGNPGQLICELAELWSADLILVGSRGLKGLQEIFLGSVSNYVTHHAPCSVLIMRQETNTKSNSAVGEEDRISAVRHLTTY